MHIKPFFIFVLLLGATFIGCSTATEEFGEAPELPPLESMSINFDELEAQSKIVASQTAVADSSFLIALVNVSLIKQLYDNSLELPQAILEGAKNVDPEFIGDATWQWTYSSSSEQGIPFSVRLTATLEPQWISWNFYVSVAFQQTDWDDVLLFSGTTSYDGTEGTWSLYNPVSEVVIYSMEWQVLGDSTTILMKIDPNENEAATYEIVYTFVDGYKTVTFADTENETQTTIRWNVETGAGSIVSPNYNGGVESCWDENRQNTTCS